MKAKPKVAIACQGGGSHAAFAAGVLQQLFTEATFARFDLVGLSGTSGGAMCASLAWAGLLQGGPGEASARLERFWEDLEVRDPMDAAVNDLGVWLARLPVSAEVSPYAYEPVAESALRALLLKHLDLDGLRRRTPVTRRSAPRLYVGATDIQSGDRVIFDGEHLTYDQLVASAAVPPLFRAVEADRHLYWDGLFSTNPPVREFTDLDPRPDEIWVVQINPQRRTGEPRSMREIADRRNELAGNLSLGQELYFIDRINRLLRDHATLRAKYKKIVLRVVELGLSDLDYPSKLDRSADFIESLLANGRARAELFFASDSLWPRDGCVPAKPVHRGRPR